MQDDFVFANPCILQDHTQRIKRTWNYFQSFRQKIMAFQSNKYVLEIKSMSQPKQIKYPVSNNYHFHHQKTLHWCGTINHFPPFSVYICEYTWKLKGSKFRISLLMLVKPTVSTTFFLLKPKDTILLHSLPRSSFFLSRQDGKMKCRTYQDT